MVKEYLQLLLSISSGNLVHVHDIFTPKDYPKAWLVDQLKFWNEQYLLKATLGNSSRYRLVASVNHLKDHRLKQLPSVCLYLTADRETSSIYFETR